MEARHASADPIYPFRPGAHIQPVRRRERRLSWRWRPSSPAEAGQIFIPPNCEWAEGRGGAYLDCDLPPECELVPFEGPGGVVGFEVECDVDPGCYLATGEWNGVIYFYIDCWESECIGGCDPVVPVGLGLKN